MEYQLSQLTFQEVTLKQELATLEETININALNNWEENVVEFLADLRAGVEELKFVAPQTPEERKASKPKLVWRETARDMGKV